jgi:peptidoglycan/LPS O-acetylase OafA/YrhL
LTLASTIPASSIRSYRSDSRLVGLDFLRFLATSVVLCDHAKNFGEAGKLFANTPGLIGIVLSTVSSMGWTAVQVFFVLSGFLVSGLLIQEVRKTGNVSPGRFLIRRGFKIYPAFWVMITVTIFWVLHKGGAISTIQVLSELFYFQNYGRAVSFHTWSLAVEEHFYFLLAGIFLVVKWWTKPGQKLSLRWMPDLFLAVAVLCVLARGITWEVLLSPSVENYHWFILSDHAVIDSLFFGMLLSYYWHNTWSEEIKRKLMILSVPLAVAGVCLLLPVWPDFIGVQWFRIFGFIMLYLGAGCLLLSSLALDYFRCPRWVRSVAWLGQYSYSVYLWHLLSGYCVFPILSIKLDNMCGWILNAAIYFVSTWLVGIILARLIEFPVIRYRDRWYPSPSK